MSSPMQSEPIITAAGVAALVGAGIALLTSFGVPLTVEQEKAILSIVVIVAPLVIAFVARRYAFAPANVIAYQTGSGLVVAGDASPIPTGTPVDVDTDADLPGDDIKPELEPNEEFPAYDEDDQP